MKKRIFVYLILFQLTIIFILSYLTFNKNKREALGTSVIVNPIRKDSIVFKESGSLNYFYEPKPSSIQTIDLNWMGSDFNYKVQYKINSDGLNQLNNYGVDKPEGIFRIITLGDSFTFGANVNTEENYPSQLQELLDTQCKNRFQVLNLGVGGYDIQYNIERYKLRGQKYNPDLILWLVIDDDLQPKPAYFAVLDVLKNTAETSRAR